MPSSFAHSIHPTAPEFSAAPVAIASAEPQLEAETADGLGDPLQRGIAQPDSSASSQSIHYGGSVIPDLRAIVPSSGAEARFGQNAVSPRPPVSGQAVSGQAVSGQASSPPSADRHASAPVTASQLPEMAALMQEVIAQGSELSGGLSQSDSLETSPPETSLPERNPANSSDRVGDQSLPFPAPASPNQPLPDAQSPAPAQSLPLPSSGSTPVPLPTAPAPPPAPATPSNGSTLTIPGQGSGAPGQPPRRTPRRARPPVDRAAAAEVIELDADRQEFDQLQHVFTAEGHAVMRFRRSVLAADRIQVNLPNRIAVAEGNVSLTRGQQVLQGNRFEYNFVQGEGSIFGAGGQLNIPAAAGDLATTLPSDVGTGVNPTQSVGSQVIINQPLQVQGSSGGITVGISRGSRSNRQALGGQVNRLRYEADRIDFTPDGWVGTNVRITNDPFSPPELEVRSRHVTFRRISQTASELRARNPRVVFDQGFSLPLFRNRIVFDSRKRQPGLVQFGFDQRDRGGFFIERPFEVLNTPAVSLTITPQILLQRAYDNGFDFANGSAYGLRAQLSATLSPTTTLTGDFVTTSLDFGKLEDNLRTSLRAQQLLGGGYTLAAEYIYRDRLFNGSLGFQNVQSSVGFVLTSPNIVLGNTGINFSYQGGIQFITANTDRADLQNPNNRVDLTRYQASAALSRGFYLWTGRALPPTATEGLRYTPNPILPYVALSTGVRGVFSAYSSGDTQSSLEGTIALSGQFGHFSKDFLDYTAFRLSYSNTALDGSSPFLFDRVADEQTVSLGFTQQIFGPITFGIQTSLNLGTSRTIDTVYTLEYSRRTYTIDLSYSPVRKSAALTLRISDFNWLGDPGRFSGLGANSVRGGAQQSGQ